MSSSSNIDSDSDEERALREKVFRCVDTNDYKTLQHLFETTKYDTQSLVDATDENDDNLLKKAIKRRNNKCSEDDNTKIIELLINYGADPEAKNDSGYNAYTLLKKRRKQVTDGVDWVPVERLLLSAKNMDNDQIEPMETEEWSFTQNSETYKSGGLKSGLHGTIYQLQLLVLFLHRAVHAYDSVLLATELNIAAKFDDVVLKFKTHKQSKFSWRFLQAKHILHVKTQNFITESELFNANDKNIFAFGKYFQSFCQIKDNDYFNRDEFEEFTICTNTKFSDDVKKYFKEDKEVKTDKILYMRNQGVRKYKLTAIGKEKIKELVPVLQDPNNKVHKKPTRAKKQKSADKEYKDIKLGYLDEFVDKFRFIVNYPDRSRLNVLLKKEVGKNAGLLDADLATNDLKNSLLEWFISYANAKSNFLLIKDGREFLNRISLRIKLLMVSGLSRAHPEKLSNYNIKFQHMPRKEFDTFFKTNDYHLLHVISEATLPSCIKVNQYLEEQSGFYLKKDSVIFLPVSKMRLSKIQKLIFDAYGKKGSHNLLLLDCGKQNSKIEANKLFDILCNCVGKKLVVIGGENNILMNKLLDSHSRIKCLKVKDESSFKDLTPATQQRLMQTSIHFQGHEIPLYDILDSNAVNNLLDSHMIESIIKRPHLRIDDPPAFEPLILKGSGYINRTFSRQSVKSFVLLRTQLLNSHLMLVSNATPETLVRLRADRKFICLWKDFEAKKIRNGILAISPEEDIEAIFVKVCKRKKENGSVYWLDYSEGVLYFERVHGSISHFKDFIGSGSSDEVREEVFTNSPTAARKVVILAGDPGSGKSTFIENFYEILKSTNTNMWVKKINLNNHSSSSRKEAVKALDSVTFTEKDHDLAVDFLTHMLFGIKKESAEDQVEKELFKQSLLKSSNRYPNIILLFDGFDEICPTHKENTLILLKALQNTRVTQMWITTRRHEKWNLEAALDSPAIFLNPLDSMHKLKYIESLTGIEIRNNLDVYENMCNHLNRIKLSADESETAGLRTRQGRYSHEELVVEDALNVKFANTPLQIKMLVEVLMTSHNYKIRNLRILDLYRLFINKKISIYHNQKVPTEISNLAYIEICQRDSDGLISSHERLAYHLLFPQIHEDSIYDVDRIGLIRVGLCVSSDSNSFKFMHRSFAEYFVSGYIVKNLQLRSVQSLLFGTIFAENGYSLVRMFLEENEMFLSNFSQNYEALTRLTEQQLSIYLNMLSREELRHTLKISLLVIAERNLELLKPIRNVNELKLSLPVMLILHSRDIFSLLYDSVMAFDFKSAIKRSKVPHVCHPTQILFKCYEGSQITELLDIIYDSEASISNMFRHTDEHQESILHVAARRGRFDHIQQLLVWIDQKTGSKTLPSCSNREYPKCRCLEYSFEQQQTSEIKLSLLMLNAVKKYHATTFMHVMNYHESLNDFLKFLFQHFERPNIEHLLRALDWNSVSIINYCVMTLQKDDRVLRTLLESIITHLDPVSITDLVLKVDNFKNYMEFIDDSKGEEVENKSYSTLLHFCLDHFEPQTIEERLLKVEGETLLHYTVVHKNGLRTLLNFLESTFETEVIKELLFHPNKRGRTPLHLAAKIPLSSSCCRILLDFAKDILMESDFTRLLLTQDNLGNSVLHSSCNHLARNLVIRDVLEYCRTNLSKIEFKKLVFLVDMNHQTFIFQRDLSTVDPTDPFILRNGLCAFNGTDLEQLLNIVNNESMTILHVLVQNFGKRHLMDDILNNVKKFCSAENIRNVILKLDGRGRTSLHFSAHESDSVNYLSLLDLCMTRLNPSTIRAILLQKDQDDCTVLHHAISHKLQVTSQLISFIGTDPKILLNFDQKLRTPLHIALLSGQPLDVVLNGLLVPTKSIGKESLTTLLTCTDSTGNTILHYSQNIFKQGYELLEFLREHLEVDQFRAMLCQHNNEGFTLLHHSAGVLKHLNDNEVLTLLQPGRLGTLLHSLPGQVEEDDICKLLWRLRKRFGNSEIQKFVMQTDEHERTAMHSSRFSKELWNFCFKFFDREKLRYLLIIKDEEGMSVIHHNMILSDIKHISYLLDKIKTAFDDDTLKSVLCVKDLKGQTPIDVMVNQCPSNAAVLEVVLEFVGPDNFLYLLTHSRLLHVSCKAPKILKYLISYVKNHTDAASFDEFVSSSDRNGRNVLQHAILTNQIYSIEYLVHDLEQRTLKQLMLSVDAEGATILHGVVAGMTTLEDVDNVIKAIRECLDISDITSLFLKLTHQGKSVLHSIGTIDDTSRPAILEFAMEVLKEDELIQLLCWPDKDNRTGFHYALSYNIGVKLIQLLQLLSNNRKILERLVLWQDMQGHTALHMAIMFSVSHYSVEVLLKFIQNHLSSKVLTSLLSIQDSERLSILQFPFRYQKNILYCYIILGYARENLDDSAFDCLISAIDSKGRNILHYITLHETSLKSYYLECVKICVTSRCGNQLLSAVDPDGRTVLHHLMANSRSGDTFLITLANILDKSSILKLLKSVDKDQRTPLHVTETNNTDVAAGFQMSISFCYTFFDIDTFYELISLRDCTNQSIFLYIFAHLTHGRYGFLSEFMRFLIEHYDSCRPLLSHINNQNQNFLHIALKQKYAIEEMQIFHEFLAKMFPDVEELCDLLRAKDTEGKTPLDCSCYTSHLEQFEENFQFYAKMTPLSSTLTRSKDISCNAWLSCILMDLFRNNMLPEVLVEMFTKEEGQAILNEVYMGGNVRKLLKYAKYYIQNNQLITPESMFLKTDRCVAVQLVKFCIFMLYQDL